MQKQLLTNGNVFKRTDGRWNGVVWYMDEQGQRKRKSFSGTSKQEVKEKITAYIAAFNQQLTASDEPKSKFRYLSMVLEIICTHPYGVIISPCQEVS